MSAVLLISVTAFGQTEKSAPANVKSAFSQKFSKATDVKWSIENAKEWEAEFKMDGKEYSANFDNAGVWIETEYVITAKEIPAAVKTTLDKEAAGFKVDESAVTETKDGKAFEFVLSKDKKKSELSIDKNGKVLNREPANEENEKEEK